tara:strand:- start:51 stop:203 length:153 start_codon:yes stop_codon:yes gene_type:complete
MGSFDDALILFEVLVVWLPEIGGLSVDGTVKGSLLFFEEVCATRHFFYLF